MIRHLAHIPGVILAGLATALLIQSGPTAVALVLIVGAVALLAAACYVEGCRQIDANLATREAAETEARRIRCDANRDFYDKRGVTR